MGREETKGIPRRRERIVLISLIFIMFVIGYAMGFESGVRTTIAWGVELSKNFMTIEFDEDLIAQGLYNYQNRVNACFENDTFIHYHKGD